MNAELEIRHHALEIVANEGIVAWLVKHNVKNPNAGHTTLKWRTGPGVEGDLDEAEAVKEAERVFNEFRAASPGTQVQVRGNGDTVLVPKGDKFDPEVERYVMLPPLVGGAA